jgi:hypothetical protein
MTYTRQHLTPALGPPRREADDGWIEFELRWSPPGGMRSLPSTAGHNPVRRRARSQREQRHPARDPSEGMRIGRFVRVAIVGLSIGGAALLPKQAAACTAAEPVRVLVDGVTFALPAWAQPHIDPIEAVPQRFVVRDGRRIREFCQKNQKAAPVRNFSFNRSALTAIAARDADLSQLSGLHLLAVLTAPPSGGQPVQDSSGDPVEGGLYRRKNHVGAYELTSTSPMLFGAPVRAYCGRAGTLTPSTTCDAWGRMPNGSLIRVKINDQSHALGTWPATFLAVEHFIRSLQQP